MSSIRKVAIFGASGNFGTPITAALRHSGYDVTIISRDQSTTTFPPGAPVIKAATYSAEVLTPILTGQDAVVSVNGPAGMGSEVAIIDAAEAAGVKRFIINDFGWGPNVHGLPEFDEIHARRRGGWDHAKTLAMANPKFTWTGITIGNPIDWALRKFPLMGFDVAHCSAIIYDSGTEMFTGTTLEGIGQAVVGVLQNPKETANRFVKAQSIQTCQNELLEAFQTATGQEWDVQRATTKEILKSGRSKLQSGKSGWILDLVVAQLFDEDKARCLVSSSREESDAELLGMADETPQQVVTKTLNMQSMTGQIV